MAAKGYIVLLLFLVTVRLEGQNKYGIEKEYYFFPGEPAGNKLGWFIGASMAQLPTKIVEDMFDQVPMIEAKIKLGLLSRISGTAEISTNIFTNLLTLGAEYTLPAGRFRFAAGAAFLFWYGFLRNDDFRVSVLGWGCSPGVTAGYEFDNFVLSIKTSIDIKTQNTFIGSLDYTKGNPRFTGVSVSLAVEQPLWKNNFFAIGFRAHYTNFFYKAWVSFTTFEEYLFYPEFFAGFIL